MKKTNYAKQVNLSFAAALSALILCGSAKAAKPLFDIIPTTATKVQVPANGMGTVSYTVTNNTKVTRTMTFVPIAGITQAIGGCANPFTLAPNQSCLLTLTIDGATIADNVNEGPVICKTMGNGNNAPSPYLCSQTTLNNRLMVTKLTTNTASITVNPTMLSLVAGSGTPGQLTVTNTSAFRASFFTVSAQNVMANLPPSFNDVTQDASNCVNVPPGGNCQLRFTPGANQHPTTSIAIMGTNTNQVNVDMTVTAPNPANITVTGSPLNLTTNGAAGNLTVTNNALVVANNVSANLAGTALDGNVNQDASACNTIPVGGNCNLVFTPGANPVNATNVNVAGTNTTVVNAVITVNAGGGGGGPGGGIGSMQGGGIVACKNGAPFLELIAAQVDNSASVAWLNGMGNFNAFSPVDGATNTANFVAGFGGSSSTTAAGLCNNFEIDSAANMPCQGPNVCFNDWFLPSVTQLACLFINRAAIGNFFNSNYWSSTQLSNTHALSQSFGDGSINPAGDAMPTLNRVRCVRNIT